MAVLSKEFADDPCSKPKRQQMILAARALLTSVTRLLILADLVDVQLILKSIRLVCSDKTDSFFFGNDFFSFEG
jgi:catenin alpha